MTDRIVFVTGAATGIGRATVERLHREGWSIALFDIDGPTITALAAALGPRVVAFPGSVGDLAALEAAMAETVRRFGRIDAVFANAGIARAAPVMLMEEADWLRVVDVNLNGVFRTLKAAAPHLRASRGYVLVTSSITSTVALPFGSAYVATKAAVLNLAEAFRTEMCGYGVEVGTIHPTFIRTPLVEGAIHGTEIGRRAWHRLFGWIAGYGYEPFRVVKLMIAAWFISSLVYVWADQQAAIGPSNALIFNNEPIARECGWTKPKATTTKARWTVCGSVPQEYTTFNPFFYSLDLILPLVDLQQDRDWSPMVTEPDGVTMLVPGAIARFVMWAEILLGWFFSLIFVAALSGLTKGNL